MVVWGGSVQYFKVDIINEISLTFFGRESLLAPREKDIAFSAVDDLALSGSRADG